MSVTYPGQPPSSMTITEFQNNWATQGWKLIYIGPTATWRQEWEEWEAVRDLVQNALDETESYTCGIDEYGLWIKDNGKGIGVADFLLGPQKVKPEYARGRFGEGMKIACLTFLRKGYGIHVKTVGRELWIVFIEQVTNGHVQSLAAMWRPGGIRQGTEFHIIGYKGDDFRDRFAVNLPPAAIKFQVASPVNQPVQRYNQLIQYDFVKKTANVPRDKITTNRIYGRDIYMRDIKSPFSYNLWGFKMAPDRNAPAHEDDLWQDIARIWMSVDNINLMVSFFKMMDKDAPEKSDEFSKLQMYPWVTGVNPVTGKNYDETAKDNRAKWQEAFNKVYGQRAVLSTSSTWNNMIIHFGFSPVELVFGIQGFMGDILTTDTRVIRQHQADLRKTQIVPENQLSSVQWTNLYLARRIAKDFRKTSFGTPLQVHAGIIPRTEQMTRTTGMYDTSSQEIILAIEVLDRGRSTVDTLIHEIGHHLAYMETKDVKMCEDLTEYHAQAMTRAAAAVFKSAIEGNYDDLLREVNW